MDVKEDRICYATFLPSSEFHWMGISETEVDKAIKTLPCIGFVTPIVATRRCNLNTHFIQLYQRIQTASLTNRCEVPSISKVIELRNIGYGHDFRATLLIFATLVSIL